MTPLATARADAVICRSAARALRRGDNPLDVARFIATYCGVVIPIPRAVTYAVMAPKTITTGFTTEGWFTHVEADTPRRRRWPWSK